MPSSPRTSASTPSKARPVPGGLGVDLVLGGGGVRGVAHVGALAALKEHGYEVRRVAGASSGAIAGAMIAAGASPQEMKTVLGELNWRAITTSDITARLADAPLVGPVISRLRGGRTLDPREWIGGLLEERGVHTWADLRLEDAAAWIPENQRYRLVVRCLDVVHSRVVRLPWDYHRYGLDPDEQPVADAVRASMAVPLVFDAVPIGDRDDGGGLLIDGGLGSGFNVDVLDRLDGRAPEHPTFALRLLQRQVAVEWPSNEFAFLRAVVQTMIETGNEMRPVGPCDEARSVGFDTSHVRTMDVGITPEQEEQLFEIGHATMTEFLDDYDHAEFVRRCHGR